MPKFIPFEHQQRSLDIVLKERNESYGFFLDTGTGKSLLGLYLIDSLPSHLRWIIITPKSVINSWEKDKTDYFPHLDVGTVAKYKKQSYFKSLYPDLKLSDAKKKVIAEKRIVIANPELIIPKKISLAGEVNQKNAFLDIIAKYAEEVGQGLFYVPEKERGLRFVAEKLKSQRLAKVEGDDLFSFKAQIDDSKASQKRNVKGLIDLSQFDGLIFDESSRLKSPKSAISKICHKFSDTAKHVFLLSGTPAPNSALEFWSQMRCIDPTLLGESEWDFRNRYAYKAKTGAWIEQKGADKEILELVRKKAIFVNKRDVLKDLPPLTEIDRYVVEDKEVKKQRLELQKVLTDEAFSIGDLLKFRTMASGFVYEQDLKTGKKTGKVFHINNAKLDLLSETLEEIGDHKVIIWAQFKADADRIVKRLGRVNCAIANSTTSNHLQREIDAFTGHKQYLIAHPDSIGVGVNGLQKVCNYSIAYNQSYSWEQHYQSISRLERNGQKNAITHINLIVKGSIEELILAANKAKAKLQDFMRTNLDWKNIIL